MKKIIIRTIGGVAAVVLLFLIYMVYLFYDNSSISKGKPIARYQKPATALLVIDIQGGTIGPQSIDDYYQEHAEELIANVNRVISVADSLQMPVIYITQETTNWLLNFFTGNIYARGFPGSRLDGRLKLVSGRHLPKQKMDSFSNPELDDFLTGNQVGKIIVVGLDAAFCVNRTVFAARNRGYEVEIISDAILSGSDSKKREMIGKFKSAGITLLSLAEFLEGVSS